MGRDWIEAEDVSRKEVIAAARKIDPVNVARVLTSAMEITLQGSCATARSMGYLQEVQSAMPEPEYARSPLRVIG